MRSEVLKGDERLIDDDKTLNAALAAWENLESSLKRATARLTSIEDGSLSGSPLNNFL
jgi:hypothetical protein